MKKKKFYFMTEKEYQSQLSGINVFFGAVIGVVMADVDIASTWDYAITLVIVGGFVTTLLYVSATKHRLAHAIGIACALAFFWYKAYSGSPMDGVDSAWLQLRLLPTLSVWLAFIVFTEFFPREKLEN